MRNSTIPAISAKQRARMKTWKAVTEDRIERLGGICEWCRQWGTRTDEWNPLEGHHMIKRRYNNDQESNCFVCHRVSCHQVIDGHSIKVYRGIKGIYAEGDAEIET